ncbi:protein timeless-like [Diadema antillarum]|uniref:protein timeless-like n=1 Tax=Diadema antillarum TaxID=105358 RepID=UPI003A84ADA5
MEWLIMVSGLSATATNLGYQEDSKYVIAEECYDSLEQILNSIMQESKVTCQARRNIGNSRLIQMDLIPILCHSQDYPDVFDAIVRLLMHLSMPLEVIMPIVKKLTKQDYQQRHELQKMLETIKKEFTQANVIAAFVSQMALIIEEAGSYPINKTNAETLSNCLTLLRNVLYVSYERYMVGSLNNDMIIRNLFAFGFHGVLKDLCRRSEGGKWLSSFLQVLHLMYKDTSSSKMVMYLRRKQEEMKMKVTKEKEDPIRPPTSHEADKTCTGEPSHKDSHCGSGSTSDEGSKMVLELVPPVSPPNDDDQLSPLISAHEDSQSSSCSESTLKDGGSNHDGSFSSRSNTPVIESDDGMIPEGSVGPSSPNSGSSQGSGTMSGTGSGTGSSGSSETDSEKEGRKNLKKRNLKNLAEFGVEYVTCGMDNILVQCKDDLKNMVCNHYFLWQLTFFLPFSTLPTVDYVDVKLTLSAPVFNQLVYTAMRTWEEYVRANTQRNDSKSNSVFKVLSLQMSTLRQMLNAIQQFTTNPQSTDAIHMKTVLATIALTKAVRSFYLLLIRKFEPQQQTLAFLREIIMGNDLTLRIINQVQHIHRPEWGKLDMASHVRKFASRPIMRVYNYMLSKFSQNSLQENEVVMTMMHHIAVDIQNPEVLFQIPILTTFACLWESGSGHISKQSQKLIDYIVHEFCVLGCMHKEKCLKMVTLIDDIAPRKRKHETSESEKGKNKKFNFKVTGNVKGLYVPRDESDSECDGPEDAGPSMMVKPVEKTTVADCIAALKEKGFEDEIRELQGILLEICYFKLNCPKVHVGEPHIWHCCSDGKSVPIIPFTEKEEAVQNELHFRSLLHKLGLHTSQDTGRLHPSVPTFWTSDMCYKTACDLGPINKANLKFEMDQADKIPDEFKETTGLTQEGVMLGLEDLDLGKDFLDISAPKGGSNSVYFEVPKRMWCNVIKRANMGKVE